MKYLFAISIALLPTAVLAQQFTPQQMIDVMTKSPSNRNVRVHDAGLGLSIYEDDEIPDDDDDLPELDGDDYDSESKMEEVD